MRCLRVLLGPVLSGVQVGAGAWSSRSRGRVVVVCGVSVGDVSGGDVPGSSLPFCAGDDVDEDGLCRHGFPPEFCGNCHEDEEAAWAAARSLGAGASPPGFSP